LEQSILKQNIKATIIPSIIDRWRCTKMVKELSADKLRKECDSNLMRCETTEGLVPLREIIGQKRAVRALKFGLGIRERGFNVYVAGFPGTGRTTAVKNFLEDLAKTQPAPSDWCYVNNFSNEYQPKAIRLPAGKGKDFQKDMKNFIEEARRALAKAFESEDYATKREATIRAVEDQSKELINQLNTAAQKAGFIIQSTRVGLLLIPLIKGKPVSDQELMTLPQ
jgi:Cdc6-like AAA superfamily ATPase